MGNHRGSRRVKVQYVINYDAPANMEEPVMNLDKMEHVILPDMLQVQVNHVPRRKSPRFQSCYGEDFGKSVVTSFPVLQDYVHRIGRTGRAGEKGLLDEVSVWFLC